MLLRIAILQPVTNHLKYLLNVEGTQHSHYVPEFAWEHPFELFPDLIYWLIASDSDRIYLTGIDILCNLANSIKKRA